jgi:MFS transporter, SP family, sugar:H+ symporter
MGERTVQKVQKNEFNMAYVIFISSVAAIGGFLFGFDSAVINGTVTAVQKAFNSNSLGSGFSVASMLLGCAFGAFYAGKWADKYGRKPVMIMAALYFIISAIGSGLATNVTLFVIVRLIGGVAVGAASVIAPAYISEVAPARLRGRLSTLQYMGIVLGILIAFLSNYIIGSLSGGASSVFLWGFEGWAWMFWVEVIPAALYLILAFVIPESPRYLIANKEDEKAKKVLSKVWGQTGLDEEIEIIKDTVNRERKPKIKDIFVNGKILPIVLIGIGLSVFQQFVGINVIMYYGAVLWNAAGFSESNALLINVLSGAVNVTFGLLSLILVDKSGRKPLLLAGSIGMTITLGTLAFVFAIANVGADGQLALTKLQAVTALVSVHLYIAFFALSWGPVVWVLLGEMFSNKIRGAGLAVGAAAQWIANFAITMTFPILLTSLGLVGAYGIYTLFAALSVLFVLKYVKETKGKTLEEMEDSNPTTIQKSFLQKKFSLN